MQCVRLLGRPILHHAATVRLVRLVTATRAVSLQSAELLPLLSALEGETDGPDRRKELFPLASDHP